MRERGRPSHDSGMEVRPGFRGPTRRLAPGAFYVAEPARPGRLRTLVRVELALDGARSLRRSDSPGGSVNRVAAGGSFGPAQRTCGTDHRLLWSVMPRERQGRTPRPSGRLAS